MHEMTHLFMTKGAGARSECMSCYARNMLLRVDDLEREGEWWRSEFFRSERVVQDLAERLKQIEKERDDYKNRLEHLLHNEQDKVRDKEGSKRQLPDFVKLNTNKEGKNPPGAKCGHKGFSRKRAQRVNEIIEVEPDLCPICHSLLKETKEWIIEDHFVEDIIPGRIKVTNYRHIKKYCPRCRKVVRAKHPDEIANGRLGPGIISLTARLKFEMRIPWEMISKLLKKDYDLMVTKSALTQRLEYLSQKLESGYNLIQERIRTSKFVHGDESGWRIYGKNAWLWGFFNHDEAFYKIAWRRSSEVVKGILGDKYDGVLITDFYSAYNVIESKKQKCLVHFQRDLHKADEDLLSEPNFCQFHKDFDELVKDADMLKKSKNKDMFTEEEIKDQFQAIKNRLNKLGQYKFGEKSLGDKLVKRIQIHQDSMLTFLEHDEVDYHNNLAERGLRPSVVIRKISYGSRSEKGAKMHDIIMTILCTCKLQGTNFDEVCRVALLKNPTGEELLDLIYNNTPHPNLSDNKPP